MKDAVGWGEELEFKLLLFWLLLLHCYNFDNYYFFVEPFEMIILILLSRT